MHFLAKTMSFDWIAFRAFDSVHVARANNSLPFKTPNVVTTAFVYSDNVGTLCIVCLNVSPPV